MNVSFSTCAVKRSLPEGKGRSRRGIGDHTGVGPWSVDVEAVYYGVHALCERAQE
jgi:hypothetical protein